MNRYILVAQKNLSRMFHCPKCNGEYHIELRRYYDTNNTDDTGKYRIVETSVRTSCACIKEVDPYQEANYKPPIVIDVSRGIPKPKVTYVDRKTDREVKQDKTIIDNILEYDKEED